ncbi:hypothetical protein OG897_39955 [Streptomyces sp. NBC_00237]|uniref:hypothetical protein n=1 Tax=Streptomyces sp. NBC_00237 TaxID=2975687 RepID=UPI002255F9AB|nr:hypothetical protein [Streptomyces sp. NBC_00237]MCX5207567.1 hypothetical protein [Streptomyces sp. NBC_00237]
MAIQITPGPTVGELTLTWDPHNDDPRGYLDRATKDGRLESALTALGASTIEALETTGDLGQITQATASIQRELERRMRAMVVQLRDHEGKSWGDIAMLLYDDPSKRSSARGVYNAGVRQMGLGHLAVAEDDDATDDQAQQN